MLSLEAQVISQINVVPYLDLQLLTMWNKFMVIMKLVFKYFIYALYMHISYVGSCLCIVFQYKWYIMFNIFWIRKY